MKRGLNKLAKVNYMLQPTKSKYQDMYMPEATINVNPQLWVACLLEFAEKIRKDVYRSGSILYSNRSPLKGLT